MLGPARFSVKHFNIFSILWGKITRINVQYTTMSITAGIPGTRLKVCVWVVGGGGGVDHIPTTV